MQQNICSPEEDIKTFAVTDVKACVVTKNTKGHTKERQNIHKTACL